jgi:hypothetical protein
MSLRLTIILAAVLAVLTAAAGLYWKGRHEGAARERPKTEAALAQAAVAGLETEGARTSAQRVDLVIRQRDAAAGAVAQLTSKALTSEDANAPLDPDRAARLRDADDQLCLTAPGLAGCPEGGDAR